MTTTGGSLVIKVGGRVQHDPRLAPLLAAVWSAWQQAAAAGVAGAVPAGPAAICCVVHGGGDEVSVLQRAAGVEPTFIGGRRVTRPDDIDRLRMALSGVANKRLVSSLTAIGLRAIGLSGEDGPLLVADLLDDGALGAVGAVRDVDVSLLSTVVAAGYLPVIAPVAAARVRTAALADPSPGPSDASPPPALNVNGDDAAAAIAVAVNAEELLLVSDVAGVRIGGRHLATLAPDLAEQAIADGQIAGGMVAKVRAALGALEGGVARVRIGGHEMLERSDAGTVLARSGATRAAYLSTSHGAAA